MWDFIQISFGTASVIALVYALWPNITHTNIKFRKEAWVAVVAFLFTTTILYAWNPSGVSNGVITQSGTVIVSDRKDSVFEVYYPRSFERPPNLKIRFAKGSGELEIVEQRQAGFKFKTGTFSYVVGVPGVEHGNAAVEWEAIGTLAK